MTLLDVLANWGPYAPALIYFWFMVAYVVAGFRGRRYLTNRQRRTYFAGSVSFGLGPAFMYFWSPWRNVDQHLLWWMIYNAVFFVWPLILNRDLIRERIRWRAFGYARTVDVLLLRTPSDTPLLEQITDAERRSNRSMYWSMLAITVGLIVVGFFSMGLGSCEWLDMATGRSGCLRTIPFDSGSVFSDIAFSPDGSVMAAADFQGPLRFYNVADGTLLRELPRQQIKCGKSVAFSPDNKWVATISMAGVVSIWDAHTSSLVHALKAITDTSGIEFSPDGKYLAVSVARFGLQFWRTTDWVLHRVLQVPVFSFSFSADGRWLAAETENDRIGIWKMDDGTVYQTIHDTVYDMALTPDGKELAIASVVAPSRVWDVSTGALARTIAADASRSLAYSPDGRYLLVNESFIQFIAYIYQVSLWRTTDGQRVATLPAYNSVGCAAFAARSDVFAYSDWKSVKIFRLRQY